MNTLSLAMNALKRDIRSGELQLIALAIFIAVASLTSVGFFTDRVERATEIQATELLAADLVLRSSEPIGQSLIDAARIEGLTTTLTTSFRSVVVANDKLQMADVKAITEGYPIRGRLRTAPTLFGVETTTDALPTPGNAWADSRLLQNLDIEVGDSINLGAATLTISRVLTYEPDRGGDLFNIAPRLLINQLDLDETKLILPGSRIQYQLLLGGNIDAIARYKQMVNNAANDHLTIRGVRDARPELKTALERAEQFLGLAALVSIALAGLAVAMSAQRYAVRHFDNCAIMRCLGAEQNRITQLYFIQLLLVALTSALAGSAIGYLAQEGLSNLMSGLTAKDLPAPTLMPFLTGLMAGVVTVLGFAMPQLLRLRNVSPMRVLRRDLTPLPLRSMTTYTLAILTLALLTPWQSGKQDLTLYAFAGILLTGFILTLGAKLLIRLLNRLRSRVGVATRYGLANIARRAGSSTAQILGIGLGVMVLLLLTLIRTDLLENWKNRLPQGTPNYFLINIQPDEVPQLQAFLKENAALSTDLFPMIRARLLAINDNEVDPSAYPDQRAQRLAAREFNLSWVGDMQKDNRLTAGEWWPQDTADKTLFSVEEGIAKTLGITLHDTLTYSIAGRETRGEVTSLRWVEWDSFNVNFFVVANPGALDDLPATYITSFHLPPAKRSLLIELVKNFPSVTIIDVDALLNQVRSIMDQVIKTIEFVFGFTLLAGLLVMFAALQTTHDERARESALLTAIGANRNQVLASLTAEFLCIGLIAGVLAAFAATIVELILAEFVFKIEISVNPWVWLLAPSVCTAVITIGGLLGTRRVLYTPPVESLRRV